MSLFNKIARLTAAVAVAGLLAACGGGGGTAQNSGTTGGGSVIRVGTLTGVLPYESFAEDGVTMIGYEPELINEAARRIGSRVEYTVIDFGALLTGLDSKRFDVAMAGFTDKKERQARYEMVDVVNDKFAFVGKPDNANAVRTSDDLCGRTVGTLSGAAYGDVLDPQVAKCAAEGRSPLTVRTFDADAQGFLAVKSGQIELWPNSIPLLVDWASKNPGHAVTPFTFLEGPGAMILPKGSPLVPQVRQALQAMIDDGTYLTILRKYGVETIARKQIGLNEGK